MELIDEIKKALAEATPAPWEWKGNKLHHDLGSFVGGDGFNLCWFGNSATYYPTAGEEPEEHDIHLIANAPTWLASLIELVEQHRSEMDDHGPEGRNYTNGQYVELRLKYESLQKENQMLHKAWNASQKGETP